MYIDLDVESEIASAVEEYLANGGDRVITYEEYDKLMTKLGDIEKELKELNFWKADRNHNHHHDVIG